MKILFVTSECAPFSKSGGLADVAYSLPPALVAEGNEVAVITPMYQCVKERYGHQLTRVLETEVALGGVKRYCGLFRGELNGVTMWFVDHEDFFLRPKLYGYDDDKLRFACRKNRSRMSIAPTSELPSISPKAFFACAIKAQLSRKHPISRVPKGRARLRSSACTS